ncbi:TniQ family protein [Sphingomonas sp. CROZ-RG-20F-R02-07]|uniref:TniQ family protein n=1 Tax=Sphingomonas sp. CROZ-RG-20F-R02-07 TaxID=2914832 RepID=UPI001F5706BD|nr:TniQ family protein [Sphingomonas sp. CROZ-RG-20F-R02-07]
MAHVRPLRKATTPIDGESARGLFCRALGDHGVPLSFTVLRRLGAQHRNVVTIAEDPEIDLEEMGRIIRVDVGELEQRRYKPLGMKRYLFFGLVVRSTAIEKKVRRFSPKSLAMFPHMRALWELRDLPFCAESWDLLVDSCVCKAKQGWIRLNGVHRCDDCGRPLANVKTEQVPKQLQSGLSLVAGLANPLPEMQKIAIESLPERLRGIDRSRIYDCILQLRRALIDENPDWSTDLLALHAACVAVLAWPTGIADLRPAASTAPSTWNRALSGYANLVPAQVQPVFSVRPRSGAGAKRTVSPKRGVRGPAASVQPRRPAVALPHSQDLPPASAGVTPAPSSHKSALIGIRPAYELAKLSPETLVAARSNNLLARHERLRGGRIVPAFDPQELVRFADLFRSRLSAESVGYRLGMGRRAVQDITACGHISANGISLVNDEAWFTEPNVAIFEARVVNGARPSLRDPINLRSALMAVHGRPKPWGEVVGAMLAGDLPYAFEDVDGKLFENALVEGSSAAAIGRMASTTLSGAHIERVTKSEALEILNATNKSSAVAALDSSGTNPVTFKLGDVTSLAQRGVSVLEIATATGRSAASTYHVVARAGIMTVAHGLWDRLQAERIFPELSR